jgi:methylenetetrahydrofolate reductase (NADPH)
MKIIDLFQTKRPILSFELFPPKRDGDLDALFRTAEELKRLSPDFVSITYGAGGSTQNLTHDIAVRLKASGMLPLVHFTCVGHSRHEIKALLERLRAAGLENLLALRGDPPKGQAVFTPAPDGFRYATELVRFIRNEGFDFCLGVAGYPEGHVESPSRETDWEHLNEKISAGGQFVVTQLFFDNQDYFRFVERLRARGCDAPVQPGIWLLTDAAQLDRIGSMSGGKIPEELKRAAQAVAGDKDAVTRLGIEFAVRQCSDLLENGAPGIHFYTMNKSYSATQVVETLKQKGFVAS